MSTTGNLPSWLRDTPECTYTLSAFDCGGCSVQDIPLTIDEYKALKRRLAEIEGIEVPKDEDI